MNRRTKDDIFANIIEYIILNTKITKTKMMQKCNTTFKNMNEYIYEMEELSYIKQKGEQWIVFKEGLLFLKNYYRLKMQEEL